MYQLQHLLPKDLFQLWTQWLNFCHYIFATESHKRADGLDLSCDNFKYKQTKYGPFSVWGRSCHTSSSHWKLIFYWQNKLPWMSHTEHMCGVSFLLSPDGSTTLSLPLHQYFLFCTIHNFVLSSHIKLTIFEQSNIWKMSIVKFKL